MLQNLVDEIHLIWRLLLDSRIPVWQRAIPIVALVYVLSPLDFIPDLLIGLGQLDDLAILLGGVRLFRSLVPPEIIEEHEKFIAGEIIDAKEYKVKREE